MISLDNCDAIDDTETSSDKNDGCKVCKNNSEEPLCVMHCKIVPIYICRFWCSYEVMSELGNLVGVSSTTTQFIC